MTNMRRGFTMIELIFVIVIIGILAAVAIPKLAATRDDAKISNVIANTRTIIGDMTAFYTSQGATLWNAATFDQVSAVPMYVNATCNAGTVADSGDAITDALYICAAEGGVLCITVDANATHVTVTPVGQAVTDTVCNGVVNDPAIVGIAGTSAAPKVYQLGGVGVVR